ncbi:MAG: Lrp/AsnC ligand binding domain-containing protein [Dehalococcoidia bacterium]
MKKVQKSFKTFEPDEMDMKLVTELEVDARQSTYALAAKLGTSPSTVFRRMQKLIDAKVIIIAAVTNPPAMGFKTAVLIGINTRPGKSLQAAKHITSLRSVGSMGFRYLSTCTGPYDLLYFTVFRTPAELLRFVDKELTVVPDLINIQVMPVLRIVKNSWMHVGSNTSLYEEPSDCHFDQSDIDLIEQLIGSPRESATSLARKIGMSKAVASKRLQALLDRNVVSVLCIADPTIFGYHISAGIWVKVLPGNEISMVAETVASYPKIQQVTILGGLFDMFLHCKFQDLNDLNDFLVNELGNAPGIMRLETMLEFRLPDNPFSIIFG